MTVSICVIAYNEEKVLPRLLEDIKAQTYDHSLTEVVLVDGRSTDGTLAVMKAFETEDNGFYAVRVLTNEKRIQAAGWNVAIQGSTGDVIMRIDAHSHLPSEFVEKNVYNLTHGEDISGGKRPCINENDTKWGEILLRAENSLFGSSPNSSRRSEKKAYVKTMFHASYKREVFEKAGLFDERLLRTEDNEMHYRIRQAGYRFCYDPEITSYQLCRSTFRKMVKQKYGNGYWIGLTLKVCPKCFSLYHFIPLAFVLAILATTVLAFFGLWWLAVALWSAYALFAVGNTVLSSIGEKFNGYCFLMPILFLVMHVAYGVGTLWGILCAPFHFRKK